MLYCENSQWCELRLLDYENYEWNLVSKFINHCNEETPTQKPVVPRNNDSCLNNRDFYD